MESYKSKYAPSGTGCTALAREATFWVINNRKVPRSEVLTAVHKPRGGSATTSSTTHDHKDRHPHLWQPAEHLASVGCTQNHTQWQIWVPRKLPRVSAWTDPGFSKSSRPDSHPCSYLEAHLISPLSNSLTSQKRETIAATSLGCLLLPKAQQEGGSSPLFSCWKLGDICISNSNGPPSGQSHF